MINIEDILSKLSKEKNPKDSFLVTLDINSMYTNIGIDADINSVKIADSDRPDKNIIHLLELSLKGNDFEFNGEMYQQVCENALVQILHPSMSPNGKRLL